MLDIVIWRTLAPHRGSWCYPVLISFRIVALQHYKYRIDYTLVGFQIINALSATVGRGRLSLPIAALPKITIIKNDRGNYVENDY